MALRAGTEAALRADLQVHDSGRLPWLGLATRLRRVSVTSRARAAAPGPRHVADTPLLPREVWSSRPPRRDQTECLPPARSSLPSAHNYLSCSAVVAFAHLPQNCRRLRQTPSLR